ncbi:MAG: FitA-like ribbon-helix-helix domain-containing protein [Pseudonocardiaceae bacterium]
MLQVRNVPDELHEVLRRRAAESGLSLSDFVLRELQRLASRPPLAEVLERAAHRGGQLSFAQAVEGLHAERDERR